MSGPQRRLGWTNFFYNEAESETQINPQFKQQNENRSLTVFPPCEQRKGLDLSQAKPEDQMWSGKWHLEKVGDRFCAFLFKIWNKGEISKLLLKKQQDEVGEEFPGSREAFSSGVIILASSTRQVEGPLQEGYRTFPHLHCFLFPTQLLIISPLKSSEDVLSNTAPRLLQFCKDVLKMNPAKAV